MRTFRTLIVLALVSGFLALDVTDLSGFVDGPASAATASVEPTVDTIPVSGVDAGAGRNAVEESAPRTGPEDVAVDARPEVLTPTVPLPDDTGVIGVTWDAASAADGDVVVSLRVQDAAGWSAWQVLETAHDETEPGSADAAATAAAEADGATEGTEPFLAPGARAVQVRVDTGSGEAPQDVEVVSVDPGERLADDLTRRGGPVASASAAQAPAVITRAQWGADESLRRCTPTVGSTVKAGVVHHTAGTNSYTAAQSASLVRGIYAYHTGSLGWCDIGYNFLVDKYGQTFEGRVGSLTSPVIGAHAGGFNTNTVGVSGLGNYDGLQPTSAMLDAFARVFAWKLGAAYRDPLGTTQLTSAGGDATGYRAGTVVTVPVVFAHRDVGLTACPGRDLYAELATIRQRTADRMGAVFANPGLSSGTIADGGSVTATATAVSALSWTLEVTDPCRGGVIYSRTGQADRGGAISATWDTRRSDGRPAGAGAYRLTLTSSGGGQLSWPVTVTAPTTDPPQPGPVTAAQAGSFVPLPPSRIIDTRESGDPLATGGRRDVVVLGHGGVPAGGVAAVALNVTATCAQGSTASYLTVWPAGSPRPLASALNTTPADTTAGYVVAGVGAGGAVSVYNDAGTAHLIVDVLGYFTTGGDGTGFQPVAPQRVYDSRTDPAGIVTGGQVRRVDLTAVGAAAAQARGAVLNVTVAGAQGEGYVTVFPAGLDAPVASTVNSVTGADVANRTSVALRNGAFDLTLGGGAAHVVVDLVGWYTAAPGQYHPVLPSRILDTRDGTGGAAQALPPGGSRRIRVSGTAGVPATASAVVVTLTGDQASDRTFATAWPAGSARPGTSDLNLRPGRARANTVVALVGADGSIELYNDRGTTHLIADVVGWYG